MSILGEKGFDFFVGLEEEGGRRLVLVLESVFLVISMAYICLSVFFNLKYCRRERTRDKRTGHRYIFYRSLSDLHSLSSYQLFSHSSILLLLFFSSSPFSSTRNGQHVFPPAFSLASARELAYIVLTAHGLLPYLPAIKLSIKLFMYLVDYAKYYKLKQGTRSEELVSTMRCLFIIIIIRAFWVIDGKERKREREREDYR